MSEPLTKAPDLAGAALVRGAAFCGCWLLLADGGAGAGPLAEVAVGLGSAGAATWVSLRLAPPTPGRWCYGALARLILRLLWQSMVAGIAVARRVLRPRLDLRPGLLIYPVRLAAGPARAAFGALTSLVPGAVPVGSSTDGGLVYHCLDLRQPVAAGLAVDEALLARSLGGRAIDG